MLLGASCVAMIMLLDVVGVVGGEHGAAPEELHHVLLAQRVGLKRLQHA